MLESRGPQTRREEEEVQVPWMPEVFSAPIADARRAEGEAMPTNDAVPYYEGIMANEPQALIRSFAGQPRVNDPRVGYVESRRELRAFVSGTVDWLGERDALVENVALTRTRSAARTYDVESPDVSDTPQTRLNPRKSPFHDVRG